MYWHVKLIATLVRDIIFSDFYSHYHLNFNGSSLGFVTSHFLENCLCFVMSWTLVKRVWGLEGSAITQSLIFIFFCIWELSLLATKSKMMMPKNLHYYQKWHQFALLRYKGVLKYLNRNFNYSDIQLTPSRRVPRICDA